MYLSYAVREYNITMKIKQENNYKKPDTITITPTSNTRCVLHVMGVPFLKKRVILGTQHHFKINNLCDADTPYNYAGSCNQGYTNYTTGSTYTVCAYINIKNTTRECKITII